jgi:hypothetical protein
LAIVFGRESSGRDRHGRKQARPEGGAMIRSVGITGLAAIGATIAMLWLSPAGAGDQSLPGATVESVVAIAKRLNPTVAAASLKPIPRS